MEDLIPRDDFCAVGAAAFGHHWQVPLSAALNVTDRTVRRWAAEGAPAKLKGELRDILEKRQIEITKAIKLLK